MTTRAEHRMILITRNLESNGFFRQDKRSIELQRSHRHLLLRNVCMCRVLDTGRTSTPPIHDENSQ
jgi:hypothetical protein